jgi:hypothetical protein
MQTISGTLQMGGGFDVSLVSKVIFRAIMLARTRVLLWFGAVVGDFGLSQILMDVEMVCANANVRTKRQPLLVLPLHYRTAMLMHVLT